MKADERKLLKALQDRTKNQRQPYVRGIVRELGIIEKRACYLCHKWVRKGWYEYGASVLAGRLTESGKDLAVETE